MYWDKFTISSFYDYNRSEWRSRIGFRFYNSLDQTIRSVFADYPVGETPSDIEPTETQHQVFRLIYIPFSSSTPSIYLLYGNSYNIEHNQQEGWWQFKLMLEDYQVNGHIPSYLKFNDAGFPDTVTVETNESLKWSTYQIEKLPYLERVEVVPWAYNFQFNGFIDFTNPRLDIPKHCLNIYLTSTQASIISGLFNPDNPTFVDEAIFVRQICTDEPGILEPPEYYLVCGCQEECPTGTCPVECGDHICCYGSDGVAVTSIPKGN